MISHSTCWSETKGAHRSDQEFFLRAITVAEWVKTTATPAFCMGVSSFAAALLSCSSLIKGKRVQCLGPCNHLGDADEASVSWL